MKGMMTDMTIGVLSIEMCSDGSKRLNEYL